MIPLCRDQGVGLIPWSPLARGRLTRPAGVETRRSESDAFMKVLFGKTEQADKAVIDAVERIAGELNVPMAQVALAWVLAKPGMSAPIVGASKVAQVDDAVAALSLNLSAEHLAALEAPYIPRAVAGHQ
jgi:aryl-alcohol dehydrogenase-like predicted oxidoreductase